MSDNSNECNGTECGECEKCEKTLAHVRNFNRKEDKVLKATTVGRGKSKGKLNSPDA